VLALQQHGKQSALRKGRGHNVAFLFFLSKDGQFSQGFRSFVRQVHNLRPDESTDARLRLSRGSDD